MRGRTNTQKSVGVEFSLGGKVVQDLRRSTDETAGCVKTGVVGSKGVSRGRL
jgi:hypothetical protein